MSKQRRPILLFPHTEQARGAGTVVDSQGPYHHSELYISHLKERHVSQEHVNECQCLPGEGMTTRSSSVNSEKTHTVVSMHRRNNRSCDHSQETEED